jgi:hypothetical protein
MKKSLSKTGLSLSQAQSVSNLCNQESREIDNKISIINNFSKSLEHNGKTLIQINGNKIPDGIKDLLLTKAKLHATQAFLMENIKLKDELLNEAKNRSFIPTNEFPDYPTLNRFDVKPLVGESYGWSQLTNNEYNEFLENESMASHIGQFIHKNGKLDVLRKELPNIPTLEWVEINKDTKTPIVIEIHHDGDKLLTLHNELASLHRGFEQKVNYFKAKVKNIVTEKNAEISKSNADEQNKINAENSKLLNEYNIIKSIVQDKILEEQQIFEQNRQNEIKELASLRIDVDARFKEIVNKFLVESTD